MDKVDSSKLTGMPSDRSSLTYDTTITSCYQFNFPFSPYDIQIKLMEAAYNAFEESKFALLESPTGTGKSLSLICSSLSWLRDHQRKTIDQLTSLRDELTSKIEDLKREEDESGDWLSAQTRRQTISKELSEMNKKLEQFTKFIDKSEARRHAKMHGVPIENYSMLAKNDLNRSKITDTTIPLNETIDNIIGHTSRECDTSIIQDPEDIDMDKRIAQQDEVHLKPKIYYASRTHSQLSQFINEVKRTKFADVNSPDPPIKVAALASRANLCVNPEVLKLRESSAINERCMEMQKESKAEKKCPYVKTKNVNQLKDDILSSVYDIEDLVSRGRTVGACPYYASRMAIPEAELVVLPYNNLLHRETRQASSLDLQDNIVIVDEAHNILETICSIHSAPITGLQLIGCHSIFTRYYVRYVSRMSPKNAAVIKLIVQCLTALLRFLSNPRKHIRDYENPKVVDLEESLNKSCNMTSDNDTTNDRLAGDTTSTTRMTKITKQSSRHEEFMIDINKFAGASNIERFNVFKLVDFLNRSQLARKLLGFFKSDTSLDFSTELHDLNQKVAQSATKTNHCDAKNIDKNAINSANDDLKSPKRKKKKTHKTEQASLETNLTFSQRCELTSLSFLESYRDKLQNHGKNGTHTTMTSYPVYSFIEFLKSLTNLFEDGRILTDYHENNIFASSLKFVLLNPSSQFKQMTQEARSIILAGGTMQPFDEFVDLLFKPLGVNENRLSLFTCGHVINPNHLYVGSLMLGPTGKQLELSYKVRNSFENIDEIGRAIMNISFVAPGGMVCFLPSYEYEQVCFTRWSQVGIISKIETRCKSVFREPRQTSHLKPVLDEYSKAIVKGAESGRGALLFCVVGGKMSEGINFNDDLGRCIVMVGLPYANIKSGELQQKMAYYDRTCKRVISSSNKHSTEPSMSPGQKYYENLCLKGVNQSIGRAIRHKNDYAAIILLDRRYSLKTSIKNGLPSWMKSSLVEYERFGPLFAQLKSFFNNIHQPKCDTKQCETRD